MKDLKIPNGMGNGGCLKCSKKVKADVYGFFGDRASRFYCKKHLKEEYEKLNG